MAEFEHPPNLNEPTPLGLSEAIDSGLNFLTQYGWFLLAGFLMFLYFRPKLEKVLDKYYEATENRKFMEKCKKDPEWARQRLIAIEAARQKMQEDLDRKAREAAEKKKEREEKQRQEFLESTKDQGGNTLGTSKSSTDSSNKSNYKQNYFPLMGAGYSGYRAPRRSCCPSSGGCG